MMFSVRSHLPYCFYTPFPIVVPVLLVVLRSSLPVLGDTLAPPVPAVQTVPPAAPLTSAVSQPDSTTLTGAADSTYDSISTSRHRPDSAKQTAATIPPDSTRSRNSHAEQDTLTADSAAVKDGRYFSAGIGWSLGSFELLSLWENAQPDSLTHFGLKDTSFRIPFDSSLNNSDLVDTALLSFTIKEAPAVYTMSFPVHIGLVKLRGNNRFGLSVSGSWMRKLFTATIAAKADSLTNKVDFKESINVYSLFLSLLWGHRIPEKYFSIEGVGRSYFTAALDLSPLIAVTIHRSAKTAASGTRFTDLKNHIANPQSRFLHGGAAALRLGVTMVKRLNANSATDFGAWYSIQGYGYFFENGNRVYVTGIDSATTRKGRLFWVSNRLELSFSLLRSRKNNDS